MPSYIFCITAFLIGLLSSWHCLGMCGGISAFLSINVENKSNFYFYQISYNIGRILSYMLMGFIAGIFGFIISDSFGKNIVYIFQLLSGFILINLGLYINGKLQLLMNIEIIGFKFWTLLYPLIKKFVPIKNVVQGFFFGILWGNMPCGLTYSVLIWTLGFNSICKSVILMMFFGFGTFPSMIFSGTLILNLKNKFKNKKIRNFFGYSIIAFGLYHIIKVFIN